MKAPTQCVLWEKPELVDDVARLEQFEKVETYFEDSHFRRELLKCTECGQLYFYEFYEEIDWVGGNDPQYRTYIPVGSEKEAEELCGKSKFEILNHFPRLQDDFPKEGPPKIWWNTGEEEK